ncbi:MAG: cellulose biosynthesis protein BcsS [Beijerinckiaceae bacterium]
MSRGIAVLAFLVASSAAGVARAEEEESLLSILLGGTGLTPTPKPSAFVLFSGQEGDLSQSRSSGGFKLRPFRPLGEDRFILAGVSGGGVWRERREVASPRESFRQNSYWRLFAGVEAPIASGTFSFLIGPEFFREMALDRNGAVVRNERRAGVRLQIDWWSHPWPSALVTASLAAGSAKLDLWARASFGWQIGIGEETWGFLGPEASFSVHPRGAWTNLGAHWSEFAWRGYRIRASAGLSLERGKKAGPYVAMTSYRAF